MNSQSVLTCLLPVAALLAGLQGAAADELVQVAPHRAAFASQGAEPPPLFGYLGRPDGVGPLPAAIVLPGCNGIGPRDVAAASTVSSWGYVGLALDALGGGDACGDAENGVRAMQQNALAALHYFSTQPFVDPARIALIGYSLGGWAVLKNMEQEAPSTREAEHFRAAIAYYPMCSDVRGVMSASTLILIGDKDDLALPDQCRKMVARESTREVTRPREGGAPIKLIVLPGATHAFDVVGLDGVFMGHAMRYSEAAAKDAEAQLLTFLRETLGEPVPANK